MEVEIRPLQAIAEVHACEELQRRVWAMADDLEVVPLHLLVTAQRNGGLLLGAFDGDELVGFVFGFPGFTREGKIKHCSHMMGVAPAYQSHGVGYQLKLAQREQALAQGLDLATWTYDPLEGRNAYLNIHKLGGVCRTYLRDYYGPMADGLNRGLPSDRFEVEWWLDSERVQRRLAGRAVPASPGPAVQVLDTRSTAAGLRAPGRALPDAVAAHVQVEIPSEYQAIKAADPELALEWRLATREAFKAYLAAGYTVVDFVSRLAEGERRCFYLLCRG